MNYLTLDTLNKIKEKYDKEILLKINMNNFNNIVEILEKYKIENIKEIVIDNLLLFLEDSNNIKDKLNNLYIKYNDNLPKHIKEDINLLNI